MKTFENGDFDVDRDKCRDGYLIDVFRFYGVDEFDGETIEGSETLFTLTEDDRGRLRLRCLSDGDSVDHFAAMSLEDVEALAAQLIAWSDLQRSRVDGRSGSTKS